MSKRSKSKISKIEISTPHYRSIFSLKYECILVLIALCIPTQLWWINAVNLMCMTILILFNRRLLESIDFVLTAFWHYTVEMSALERYASSKKKYCIRAYWYWENEDRMYVIQECKREIHLIIDISTTHPKGNLPK